MPPVFAYKYFPFAVSARKFAALVAASSGSWEALWYVIAMAVGIVFAEQVSGAQDEEVTLLSSIANDR